MRNESWINVECIFIETLDFIDINYTNLNQTIRYEQRPHGEWNYHKEWAIDGECAFECSKCGMGTDVDYNFCPNCGASMQANDRQVTGKLNEKPKYKDIISEAFVAKLTINRMIVGEIVKKEAILTVADRFGNRFQYDITDAKSIQEMLKEYDADEEKVGDNE